jgi:hypothetical protein
MSVRYEKFGLHYLLGYVDNLSNRWLISLDIYPLSW